MLRRLGLHLVEGVHFCSVQLFKHVYPCERLESV